MKDTRSDTDIRHHYEVERRLADRLRAANRDERRKLYREVYSQLYELVEDHPGNLESINSPERQALTAAHLRGLRPYLAKDATVLEIGPGNGALALQLSDLIDQVYIVDVSDSILTEVIGVSNISFFESDGASVPVPPGSVDIAISHQVMEHLHPEDARDQLQAVFNSLAPGGVYLCFTPNRLTGPYDVSRGFDSVATGLHLREYSNRELIALLRSAGFGRIRHLFGSRGRYVSIPTGIVCAIELLIESLPASIGDFIARSWPGRVWLSGVKLEAHKGVVSRT